MKHVPLSLSVLCAAVLAAILAAPAAAQSVWELTPYRIQLLVAFAPAPEFTPRLQTDSLAGLVDRIDALIGAPWDVTVTPATAGLGRAMTAGLEAITLESLPKESFDFDKVLLLAVSPSSGGHRLEVRDFDVPTRLFSAAVSRPVRQLGKLRDVALDTIFDAFAPLARIQRVKKKYRIAVMLAMAADPKLTPELQQGLSAYLAEQVKPLAEEDRDVTVTAAPPELRRALSSTTEAVSVESFPQRSLDYDEVIALYVFPAGDGYQVATLSLNPLAKTLTVADPVPVPQLGKLNELASGALSEAIGGIRRARKTWVTLRLRAGALPLRDKGLKLLEHGAPFAPVIRYNDREGNLRRDQEGNVVLPKRIDWTFCTVQQFAAGQLVCRLHTGLRSPLSSRRRGRVQQFALAVVPPQRPSVLVLQSRSDAGQLLAGYGVYTRLPDSKTTSLLGRSDRRGRLTVPPTGREHPLRMLTVRNGGELLAQLPIVPGMEPELTARIANDDRRLEAEGFVTGLQEEMVDLVTRREVLFILTRARIKDGKFDEASELIEELRRLPTAHDFSLMLKARQKKVRSDDDGVQAKIDVLFRDTLQLLGKHLDPNAIEEVWQELRTARGDTRS